MKKTLIGLVFAISMFTTQNIFAQCVMEDVFISHCAEEGIFINKGHKPNKAPANVPVKVCMSKEEHKVYICSSSDADIEYYMCDSNNTPLLSGNCECASSVWTSVSLDCLPYGAYTIFFVINSNVYKGIIEI